MTARRGGAHAGSAPSPHETAEPGSRVRCDVWDLVDARRVRAKTEARRNAA